MNINMNVPKIYHNKINNLTNMLNDVRSDRLRDEINMCIGLTNLSMRAAVELSTIIDNLKDFSENNNRRDNERTSEILNEMKMLSDGKSQLSDDLWEAAFETLKNEMHTIHRAAEIKSEQVINCIYTAADWWSEIADIFSYNDSSKTIEKLKFIIKKAITAIPVIGTTIDIISSMIELFTIERRKIKTTDSTLLELEEYTGLANAYTYGCILFGLDCESFIDNKPIKTED